MHTESTITRTQAYITAHRGTLAVIMGATLALFLTLAWEIMAPVVFHIQAPTLALCVGIIATLGSSVAALAFYWGAE